MTTPSSPTEMVPDDVEVLGLAGERTDLAWSRTALAAGIATAAILRRLWQSFDTVSARAIVFSILGLGALAWLAAVWWTRGVVRTTLEGRRIADPKRIRRVAVGTSMFCLTALLLAAFPAPSS